MKLKQLPKKVDKFKILFKQQKVIKKFIKKFDFADLCSLKKKFEFWKLNFVQNKF